MRATDKMLFQLCDDFKQHVGRFEEHEKHEDEKFNRLIEAQQNNTTAITKLTESVTKLVSDTSTIVKLERDFRGAARIGAGLQGFLLWCLKWGAIGAGTAAAVMWVVKHFK